MGNTWYHGSRRAKLFIAPDINSMHAGIFLPFWSLGQGPVEIWTIKLGKLELDRHFKWIKKHIRN